MAPDDLCALADAIVYRDSLAIARAADYLRACADAQPVAWTDRHTAVTRFALWRFINEALSRSAHAAQKGSYEPVENVAKYQDDAKTAEEARAMLAAAPAAPQAEPKREDRRGDPPALVAWSWHDLPARAAAMRAALIAAMEIVQRERVRIAYNAKGAPPAIEIGYTDILRRLDAVIAQADAALK